MPDVFSTAKRSEVMARIRSRGNRDTELRLVQLLREHGITGWRRHAKLPGRPDFVFRAARLAVFVDGCFWHGCSVHFRAPQSRTGYWNAKIAGNQRRDRRVARLLRQQGWRVVRLWEHSLSKPASGRTIRRLRRILDSPLSWRKRRATSR